MLMLEPILSRTNLIQTQESNKRNDSETVSTSDDDPLLQIGFGDEKPRVRGYL